VITIDIEQESFEETCVGVLGYISNVEEKDPSIHCFAFKLSLNSMHFWDLHIRGKDDVWYLSYTFPRTWEIEQYHNRNVIRWLITNYDIIRTLALGIRSCAD